MKIKNQIILAALGLAVVIAALVGIYAYTESRIDMSIIEYITSMQKSPNRFLDLANDINVSSADDVGFKVEGEYHLSIHYGDQVINMTRNCFKSDEYKNALGRIGIKVYTHVNEDSTILYKVTYWDEEVEQYSLVN